MEALFSKSNRLAQDPESSLSSYGRKLQELKKKTKRKRRKEKPPNVLKRTYIFTTSGLQKNLG